MTKSNSNSNTAATSSLHKTANGSTLHCIISNAHLLHQTGYDEKTRRPTYVGNTSDFRYLESCADASITTIASGISVIGRLLVTNNDRLDYVDDADFGALGWLLNDLGASIVALQNIQTLANNAMDHAKAE